MDYGVVMFSTAYAIAPDELARALEERRFESLWIPEHTHIPASRRSPWPGGPNLPQEYWSSYDPFLALTMAAAATKRLRLGTGICLVVERDPITTAQEVAPLDRPSGGRVPFGIGGRWDGAGRENHGPPCKRRLENLGDARRRPAAPGQPREADPLERGHRGAPRLCRGATNVRGHGGPVRGPPLQLSPSSTGDAVRGAGPPGVERVTGLVEVEHEGGVIGRDRLALARLAVDLRPHGAGGHRLRDQQVVDPHAEVLVSVARPIVPPGVAGRIVTAGLAGVDQVPPAAPHGRA